MAIRKYTDWKGWVEGFYDSWMDALTSTLLALGGTNALSSATGMDIGLNWKQASGVFISVTFWSMVRYLNANKKPKVVTETIETSFLSKDEATGKQVEQSSVKTTTTPVTTETPKP